MQLLLGRWSLVVRLVASVCALASLTGLLGASTASAATPGSTSAAFSLGEISDQTVGAPGCGTNVVSEPQIHVSRNDDVFLASEFTPGQGSEIYRGLNGVGGLGANACGLTYMGPPNGVSTPAGNVGAAGGDVDLAIASAKNSSGNYNVYVGSLNLASVNAAVSSDNGVTWTSVPAVAGVPGDDREWIAAFGASTALMSFHDLATGDIDVVKSTDGGLAYTESSMAIPESDYKAGSNEIGNLVIDHRNLPDNTGDFYAYQSFAAPSTSAGSAYNEAFVAVSADGGQTWTDKPIPCSVAPAGTDLSHQFPNVSVAPNGDLWSSWSDDHYIYTAESTDRGDTWTCSGAVSSTTSNAFQPWLVATSAGLDLVYYGANKPDGTWAVYFAQNPTSSPSGWELPEHLVDVHTGAVCELGATCNTGRQLYDDFGVDTDNQGWAHITYSMDSDSNFNESLGGSNSSTGYAVQTGGTQLGYPNN
jgi:hypothetical protein